MTEEKSDRYVTSVLKNPNASDIAKEIMILGGTRDGSVIEVEKSETAQKRVGDQKERCPQCGQSEFKAGEYPCIACGRPQSHDESI